MSPKVAKTSQTYHRPLMRIPALTLLLAICCGLANGCSEGVTRRTAATVLSVKGTVTFGTAEQSNFKPVTRESRIYDGDLVRTSEGALLNLALIPAALTQMSTNSEIKIEKLRISKDGNETQGGMRSRSARIQLSRGKITVLFSRRDESASQLAIDAPSVTIMADSDCLFHVQTDGTRTRLTCVEGNVYASCSTRPPVAIGAGYSQQWPLSRPEPTVAADDAAAQIDVADSLEIGNLLNELRSVWQDQHPF